MKTYHAAKLKDGSVVFHQDVRANGIKITSALDGEVDRVEITETEYKRKDAKRLTRLGSHPTELRRNSTAPGAV